MAADLSPPEVLPSHAPPKGHDEQPAPRGPRRAAPASLFPKKRTFRVLFCLLAALFGLTLGVIANGTQEPDAIAWIAACFLFLLAWLATRHVDVTP